MQKAKVVLLVLAAAMLYGVVHDQITARLCIEYFTIAHPPLFQTESPTLIGLFWGASATWGVGILFGILLAQASQSPGLPPVALSALARQIFALLLVTAAAAGLAGLIGYELSRNSLVELDHSWRDILSSSQRDRFMAVWFAHATSYVVGLLGAMFMVWRVWNQRQRPRLFTLLPQNRREVVRAAVLVLVAALVIWLRWMKSSH